MYIDQIILNNFRVYYGQNELSFSRGQQKQINVVAGSNGFGKTSFLTGMVWALYGKLMGDVEQRFKQEIHESGGYKRYCEKLLNRLAAAESADEQDLFHQDASMSVPGKEEKDELHFSVTVRLSNLLIPSVRCKQLEIKRSFYPNGHREVLEILIDGMPNELTKSVGSDIFINDFILPKEIAKFFFFDAEKIVSLSEIKSADEKRYLSQAYAEVLGIKKYTDLKAQLENMRLRLRDKSAEKSDRNKISRLQTQLAKNEKLIAFHKDEVAERIETLQQKLLASDKYQEQLIREGSGMTLEELKSLRDVQHQLQGELVKNKQAFNDLLELAPFAIAAGKIQQIIRQLEIETEHSQASRTLLGQKYEAIREAMTNGAAQLSLQGGQEKDILNLISKFLLTAGDESHKTLLDFSGEQQNRFVAVAEHLRLAYSRKFKNQNAEQRKLQSAYSSVLKKLQDAESREKDTVVSAIRRAKTQADAEVKQLENEVQQLHSKISLLQLESQSVSRQLSELSKLVKIEEIDREKDESAERLIGKLDLFIRQLKLQKKHSLEVNILRELKRLMHKSDFIKSVQVSIAGELIDIELYDQNDQQIDKDLLSKGEQQLYATALLAALIQESNIKFPVFIDSPLQKFDKRHSKNIITQFYPFISDQVILLPLLEKELNEDEYAALLPLVGQAYIIQQSSKYHSKFVQVPPTELFDHQGDFSYVQ